jgi:hypothetical protein
VPGAIRIVAVPSRIDETASCNVAKPCPSTVKGDARLTGAWAEADAATNTSNKSDRFKQGTPSSASQDCAATPRP